MPPKSFNLRYISTKSSRFADGTLRTAFPTNQSKQNAKLKFKMRLCKNAAGEVPGGGYITI